MVALQAWKPFWASSREIPKAQGDNAAALVLLLTMRAKVEGPSTIAREVALEVGDGSYTPQVAAHIPGIANDVCDVLPRRRDPHKWRTRPWQLPKLLARVPRTEVPTWDSPYYRAI